MTIMAPAQGATKLLEWARSEAAKLRHTAAQGDTPAVRASTVRPVAAASLEFLRQHAAGTQFLQSAEEVFHRDAPQFAGPALTGVASILEGWASFVEDGMAEILPFPVGARIEAANDLLEQVQQLLDDRGFHPAASIMLAGAALEEFLRSLIAVTGVTVTGKLGINAYASALRTGDHISAQDMKDITAWAGTRNEAAHGQFGDLSRERAQLMVGGINLFVRQRTPGLGGVR